MAKGNDKLRELLKKSWLVKIDSGHKHALQHKMEQLAACDETREELEYSGGMVVSRQEMMKAGTIIRTDWRPVWAAALILLAVVIIIAPRNSISGDRNGLRNVQQSSPEQLIIQGIAPIGSRILDPEEASKINIDPQKVEKRYIYVLGELTFESKRILPEQEVIDVFRRLGGEKIDLSKIKPVEVTVPQGYYLETREGNIIYYSFPAGK